MLLQPRGGVGTYEGMRGLLTDIEQGGCADIMPVTVDSHTRLGRFDVATKCLENFPNRLNGFPVVSHGYQVMRQLNDACRKPLQIRHGSPDGRRLMAEAVAGGITSFEGGPIGYNLPYCADVSLEDSFASWAEIDELAGILTEMGHTVEREFFGSLTAVAVPPSIALACTFIEAVCASKKGVRAMSIAIPQGGNMVQDIAALEAIPILAQRYLPADCAVYSVLHQFMGIFPEDRPRADALIFSGALAGYFGKAQKSCAKHTLKPKAFQTRPLFSTALCCRGPGLRGATLVCHWTAHPSMTNAMRSCARPKSCWTRLSGKPMSRAPPLKRSTLAKWTFRSPPMMRPRATFSRCAMPMADCGLEVRATCLFPRPRSIATTPFSRQSHDNRTAPWCVRR